jgi:hypothetical protein
MNGKPEEEPILEPDDSPEATAEADLSRNPGAVEREAEKMPPVEFEDEEDEE